MQLVKQESAHSTGGDETFILNLGPQHPATHGVLHVKLTMDGEFITNSEIVCGYIHREHEKMGENRPWEQFLPNTSRIDYLSAMMYTHAWVGVVEKSLGIVPPPRAEYVRVITSELNRITSHLLWWGAFLIDLGGMTPMLYAFDDREMVLDILEALTGARLTFCYYRIGGLCEDINDDFVAGTRKFVKHFRPRLKMYRRLVTDNIIVKKRMIDVGIIDADMCRRYGATGPVLRGAGVPYDVRRAEPYGVYPDLIFDIPTRPEADCMARYLVRMAEMEQSLRIIEQALDKLPDGPFMAPKVPRVFRPPAGEYAIATEGARGRFAIRVVSNGTVTPHRVKLRTPCFCNLSCFEEASRGMLLPDALAMMGSIDLVIPDLDR